MLGFHSFDKAGLREANDFERFLVEDTGKMERWCLERSIHLGKLLGHFLIADISRYAGRGKKYVLFDMGNTWFLENVLEDAICDVSTLYREWTGLSEQMSENEFQNWLVNQDIHVRTRKKDGTLRVSIHRGTAQFVCRFHEGIPANLKLSGLRYETLV